MKVSVYNILWADNNCDSLKKNMDIREAFENENYTIEVLSYSHTTDELERDLELYKDRVDAVVIGDNLRRDDAVEETDGDKYEEVSGLIHAYSLMERYNSQREIPFILRPDNVVRANTTCNRLGLKYFTVGGRIAKDEQLADKIVEFVDKISSPEHIVTVKYGKLLNDVRNIKESFEEELHSALLMEEKDRLFDKEESAFAHLRMLMENIVTKKLKGQYIPDEIDTLNKFQYYFNCNWNKEKKVFEWPGYAPKEMPLGVRPLPGVMNPIMSQSLQFLVPILQDGSHGKEDLKYKVDEYVCDKELGTVPFLFRSCLHQVMDFVRWYSNLVNVKKNERTTWWEKFPNPRKFDGKELTIEFDRINHVYHCEDCLLNSKFASGKEGERVTLSGVMQNEKVATEKYPFFAPKFYSIEKR